MMIYWMIKMNNIESIDRFVPYKGHSKIEMIKHLFHFNQKGCKYCPEDIYGIDRNEQSEISK